MIVSVTDKGGGIQEREVERVFEPFFTTKAKGMGLGLSVCRPSLLRIARKLGGKQCRARRDVPFHFALKMRSAKSVLITGDE